MEVSVMTTTRRDIPSDVWLKIFSFLDEESLFEAGSVSVRFHSFSWKIRKGFQWKSSYNSLAGACEVLKHFGLLSEIQWLSSSFTSAECALTSEILSNFPVLRSLQIFGKVSPEISEVSLIFYCETLPTLYNSQTSNRLY